MVFESLRDITEKYDTEKYQFAGVMNLTGVQICFQTFYISETWKLVHSIA